VIAIDQGLTPAGPSGRRWPIAWSALPQVHLHTKSWCGRPQHSTSVIPARLIWADQSAQVDPQRDLFVVGGTPRSFTDFASERLGLGGRAASDATTRSVGKAPRFGAKTAQPPGDWEGPFSMERWVRIGTWPTSMPAIPIRCLFGTRLSMLLRTAGGPRCLGF